MPEVLRATRSETEQLGPERDSFSTDALRKAWYVDPNRRKIIGLLLVYFLILLTVLVIVIWRHPHTAKHRATSPPVAHIPQSAQTTPAPTTTTTAAATTTTTIAATTTTTTSTAAPPTDKDKTGENPVPSSTAAPPKDDPLLWLLVLPILIIIGIVLWFLYKWWRQRKTKPEQTEEPKYIIGEPDPEPEPEQIEEGPAALVGGVATSLSAQFRDMDILGAGSQIAGRDSLYQQAQNLRRKEIDTLIGQSRKIQETYVKDSQEWDDAEAFQKRKQEEKLELPTFVNSPSALRQSWRPLITALNEDIMALSQHTEDQAVLRDEIEKICVKFKTGIDNLRPGHKDDKWTQYFVVAFGDTLRRAVNKAKTEANTEAAAKGNKR